jgi:hypothetical protein
MFRFSDGVVAGKHKSYSSTRYPVAGLCNIVLLNRSFVTGELVLRVFVRHIWRHWSHVRRNDYCGISGPDEIFRATGLKNAADAATCHHIILAKVSYVNLISRDSMW